MEGGFLAGLYVSPSGDCVRVFQTFSGAWACAIAPPEGGRVSVVELNTAFWRALQRRAANEVDGGTGGD